MGGGVRVGRWRGEWAETEILSRAELSSLSCYQPDLGILELVQVNPVLQTLQRGNPGVVGRHLHRPAHTYKMEIVMQIRMMGLGPVLGLRIVPGGQVGYMKQVKERAEVERTGKGLVSEDIG